MPRDLNNRLEQLEKEIFGLLKIQQRQSNDIQNMMPGSKGSFLLQGHQNGFTKEKPNSPALFLQSVSEFRTEVQNSERKSSIKIEAECHAYTKPTDSTDIEIKDTLEFSNCMKDDIYWKNPAMCSEKKCKRKLIKEKEKVEGAIKVIDNLKEELMYSKARINTMANDITMLTQALQSVRTKYKNMKTYRNEALSQIEELKTINCQLCSKLEKEMKCHGQLIKTMKQNEAVKEQSDIKQTREQQYLLEKTNKELEQDLNVLLNKYSEAKNEIENLKNELNSSKEYIKKLKTESENLKNLLANEKQKNTVISKTIDKLEDTIQAMLQTEKQSQREIAEMKKQLCELEYQKADIEENLTNTSNENKKLRSECDNLKKTINEISTQESSKCKKLEKEMERLKKEMKDKETLILDEKNTLKELVQELSEVVKRHKNRIRELVHINRQQEALLKSQMVILRNKEHQIKMAEVEIQAEKNKGDNLQDQLEKLRQICKVQENTTKEIEIEYDNKVKKINDELNNARVLLQEEKDNLLIKEKIIEDQVDTIQKLKNSIYQKGDELKRNNSEVTRLQKELDDEKYEKELLQKNIEDIKWQREQFKAQIAEMERELINKRNPENLEQQKKLLQNLEQQITMKQREWEIRCKLLDKEKKRAVKAARFATQKLVDTVNDFQSHTESQRKVQSMLAGLVQNKNEALHGACQKINNFQDLMKNYIPVKDQGDLVVPD